MDVETKGNAILDGNIPHPLKIGRLCRQPSFVEGRSPPLVSTAQRIGSFCMATDRNTTPIVREHRATIKRRGSEIHRFPLIDYATVDIE